jgi:hypothetical protein
MDRLELRCTESLLLTNLLPESTHVKELFSDLPRPICLAVYLSACLRIYPRVYLSIHLRILKVGVKPNNKFDLGDTYLVVIALQSQDLRKFRLRILKNTS